MKTGRARCFFSLFFCAILLISIHSAFPKLEDVIYDVLPKDAIWAIHIPAFALPDERASYSPQERVIGLEIKGDARAYPILILSRHEIVNDVIGGVPVAVTWCPLCNTPLVYHRKVKEQELVFGVSGKLYLNGLVMYDQQTGTLWSHVTGEAIQGPLAGTDLEVHPSVLTSWGEWLSLHPDSRILSKKNSPYHHYESDHYSSYYKDPEALGIRPTRFQSYPNIMPKDFVLGIRIEGRQKAYPYFVLRTKKVVNDTFQAVPMLIVYRDVSQTALGFNRTTGRKALSFKLVRDDASGITLQDTETASLWDGLSGKAIEGKLKGTLLAQVVATHAYWFAWKDFFPDTELYF